MAVYAWCQKCKCRRDAPKPGGVECADKSAHKKVVAWRADVNFGDNFRPRQLFTTKENADIQERKWKYEYENQILIPSQKVVEVPFQVVADEWYQNGLAQGRIKSHEVYRVNMFKELFGAKPISRLSFKDGEDWLNARLKAGIVAGTINRDMKPLKWIMDYAVKKGYIKANPFVELKALKGANIRCRWMTEAEVHELVKACERLDDPELLDLVDIALNTGFRKGNLERLTARDISHNRITAVKTKSGKAYDVPIAPAIVPTLQRLVATHPTGPLFNFHGHLDKRFRAAVLEAKLYHGKGHPESVTIHTMRHTFAALYLLRGGDLHKLSKLLGHSSIAITDKVYAHICPTVMDAQSPLISTQLQRSQPSAASVIENLKTSA